MTRIQVLVKLAAIDPWSFTVLDSLRRKFGCAEVTGVERLKSWELMFRSEPPERAVEITRGLMRQTALLANPNRDIWVIRGGSDQALPSGFWDKPAEAENAYAVKVTDREDHIGRATTRILTSRLEITDVKEVCFSTIWILEMSGCEADPHDLARHIAVARSWRKGLLANPHCQDAQVYKAEEYLGMEANPV